MSASPGLRFDAKVYTAVGITGVLVGEVVPRLLLAVGGFLGGLTQ